MIQITRIKDDGTQYTILIRDGTQIEIGFYCSNTEGLKLKDQFSSEKEAVNWAYAILPTKT